MDYTIEQIKEKDDLLPKEVKAVINSAETTQKIIAVAEKYNLLIDKMGDLVDEIGLILLGLESSSTFVDHISKRLSVSSKIALSIAQDVNHDIFDSIKDYMKKSENERVDQESNTQDKASATQKSSTITSIEQVGGFNIEKEQVIVDPQVYHADRGKILDNLENPLGQRSQRGGTSLNENHTEPLIDHLLQNPVGLGEQRQHITPKVPDNLPVVEESATKLQGATAVPKPPQRTGPDPYREVAK